MPRLPPCQSWPVPVSYGRDPLDISVPLPSVLTVLFLNLFVGLLGTLGLNGHGSADVYGRVLPLDGLPLERFCPPGLLLRVGGGDGYLWGPAGSSLLLFLGGGWFTSNFYPDADWQFFLLVSFTLEGSPALETLLPPGSESLRGLVP